MYQMNRFFGFPRAAALAAELRGLKLAVFPQSYKKTFISDPSIS